MESFVGKLIVIACVTYRIYYQDELYCYLIDWNGTRFQPRLLLIDDLQEHMKCGTARLADDQCQFYVDQRTIDNLPKTEKQRYELRKAFIKEVIAWSGEDMLKLAGKLPKPGFVDIYTRYGISTATAFRIALNFAKNSPKESGLIDPRFVKPKAMKTGYTRNAGAGRKTETGTDPYKITSEDIEHMEEAVKRLKEGKYRSISTVYRWLLDAFYSEGIVLPKGVQSDSRTMKRLLPKGQRVSERQFRSFLSSRAEELEKAKKERRLTGTIAGDCTDAPPQRCPTRGIWLRLMLWMSTSTSSPSTTATRLPPALRSMPCAMYLRA